MCGVGIDRDDAIFIGELVEVGEPRHVAGILISTMEENHDRIVLLLVVARWQMHDVGAGNVIDVDLFLGVPCAGASLSGVSCAGREATVSNPRKQAASEDAEHGLGSFKDEAFSIILAIPLCCFVEVVSRLSNAPLTIPQGVRGQVQNTRSRSSLG